MYEIEVGRNDLDFYRLVYRIPCIREIAKIFYKTDYLSNLSSLSAV